MVSSVWMKHSILARMAISQSSLLCDRLKYWRRQSSMSDAENCVWQGLPLCNLHSCLANVGKLAEDEVVDADDEAADHTVIKILQDLQRQHSNRACHLMQHPSPTVVHHLGTKMENVVKSTVN